MPGSSEKKRTVEVHEEEAPVAVIEQKNSQEYRDISEFSCIKLSICRAAVLAVLVLSRLQTLGKASEIWVFTSAVHWFLLGAQTVAHHVDRSCIFVLTCPDRPIFLGCKLAFKVASLG